MTIILSNLGSLHIKNATMYRLHQQICSYQLYAQAIVNLIHNIH